MRGKGGTEFKRYACLAYGWKIVCHSLNFEPSLSRYIYIYIRVSPPVNGRRASHGETTSKRPTRPCCEVCGAPADHEVDLGYAFYISCSECADVITQDAENYFISEIIVW